MAQVAVVIPTHDRANLIGRAVASVLNQTFADFEVIVIDDGSTDSTQAVLTTIKDDRLKVIHLPTAGGAGRARNIGVAQATAPAVTFLDDDDEFVLTRLEALLGEFDQGWAFVTSGLVFIKPDGGCVKRFAPRHITADALLYKTNFGVSALVDRDRFLSLGGFDESLTSSQDHDLWLRMTLAYGPAICVRETLLVVHTEHEMPRISVSARKMAGYRNFVRKHKAHMSRSHRAYHYFKLRSYGRRSIPVFTLLNALPATHWPDVLKYQASRQFPGLRRFYEKLRA